MIMNLILFDSAVRENLFPMTLTRSVADLRVGILTVREKWERLLESRSSTLTVDYLREKYILVTDDHNLFIDGSMLPTRALAKQCVALKIGEALTVNGKVVACNLSRKEIIKYDKILYNSYITVDSPFIRKITELETKNIQFIDQLSDIFVRNAEEIASDFSLITSGKESCILGEENRLIGDMKNLFIETDCVIEAAIVNVKEGPVYIGHGVRITEGAILKGPVAICAGSTVMPAARISGGTTIGKSCKVGGEVNNAVFQGFSNKAHDGYLGNAVIGEWCNIGAGSNFSNLQNDYTTIRQWHYPTQKMRDTRQQFCGVVMGDYTKCSIGSMFNTGTVTGIGCNLFGEGFHRKFVRSFSYGGKHTGYERNKLEKMLETAEIACQRRGISLSDQEKKILTYLYLKTENDNFL